MRLSSHGVQALGGPQTRPWQMLFVLSFLALAVVLGPSITSTGWGAAGLILLIGTATFLFWDLKISLYVIFALRSIIDIFWSVKFFSIGETKLNAQSIVGVLLPLICITFLLKERAKFLGRPLVKPLLFFLFLNLWPVIFTSDVVRFADELLKMSGGWFIYFAIPALFSKKEEVGRFLWVIFIPLVIPLLSVFLQTAGYIEYMGYEYGRGRATGFYYHPWDLVRYIVVGVCLSLFYLYERKERLAKVCLIAFLGLSFFAALKTFLRYAYVAVGALVTLWHFLIGKRAIVVLLLIIIAALVHLRADFFKELFQDVPTILSDEPSVRSASLSGRVYLWEKSWAYFRSLPLYAIFWGQGVAGKNAFMHDDYMRILVDNGVLGFAFYLFLLVLIARHLLRCAVFFRRRDEIFFLRLTYAEICFFAAYLGAGVTSRPSQYPTFNWYFWAIMGLIYVGRRIAEMRQRGTRGEKQQGPNSGPNASALSWAQHRH